MGVSMSNSVGVEDSVSSLMLTRVGMSGSLGLEASMSNSVGVEDSGSSLMVSRVRESSVFSIGHSVGGSVGMDQSCCPDSFLREGMGSHVRFF
jgi:hypothetical protein